MTRLRVNDPAQIQCSPQLGYTLRALMLTVPDYLYLEKPNIEATDEGVEGAIYWSKEYNK